jgi:glycosyltransferase involved in cell wall biosynthesis
MHGKGQFKASALAQAEALDLQNVIFTDWVADPTKLSEEFAPYEVCLGAFGDTAAARMTIQNKIYEGMAMRKIVITRDTPTVRSAFNDGEHLVLCPHGDPGALAEAIIKLRDDPDRCRYIAENGYRIFKAHYTTEAVGRVAKQYLEELLGYAS